MIHSFKYNHVVLIETASNQRTIFQTNRLRENIGASQLIHRVGTDFVRSAVKGRSATDVLEVIVASGKAVLLTRSAGVAESIIEHVTRRSLSECPGVIARGAYVAIEEWSAKGLDRAIAAAHLEVNHIAARLPAPVMRFQRLPFVENCASSGYPAARVAQDPILKDAISAVVEAKRRARKPGWRRISQEALPGIGLFTKMDEFEDEEIGSDWVGIVHADGNGLGQIFLNFSAHLAPDASAETYVGALSAFSKAIDNWSKLAAKAAIEATWPGKLPEAVTDKPGHARIPVIPVVLGGDDLTVICEGGRAVDFAAHYLAAFEQASRAALADGLDGNIPALKGEAIAAAAGIAIVKPHFPFHRAYELAEQLTKSAKIAKEKFGAMPCSTLDFQVVHDSSGSELEPIRERMRGPGGERLTMRPYVVTPMDALSKASADARDWAARRHYRDGPPSLRGAVEALLQKPAEDGEDDKHLPRSQAHDLHDALYLGRAVADGRLAQIKHRYDFPWPSLAVTRNERTSLFAEDGTEAADNGDACVRFGAYLLDAMELADLIRDSASGL